MHTTLQKADLLAEAAPLPQTAGPTPSDSRACNEGGVTRRVEREAAGGKDL